MMQAAQRSSSARALQCHMIRILDPLMMFMLKHSTCRKDSAYRREIACRREKNAAFQSASSSLNENKHCLSYTASMVYIQYQNIKRRQGKSSQCTGAVLACSISFSYLRTLASRLHCCRRKLQGEPLNALRIIKIHLALAAM